MFRELTALMLAALIAVPCCCCAFNSGTEQAATAKTCCGLPLPADQDQHPSEHQPCHCQENAADRDAPDTSPPATATTWLLLAPPIWPSLDLHPLATNFSKDKRHQAPPPPPINGRHVRTLIASFLI